MEPEEPQEAPEEAGEGDGLRPDEYYVVQYTCDGCSDQLPGLFWSCEVCDVQLCLNCQAKSKSVGPHTAKHAMEKRIPQEDQIPDDLQEEYRAMKKKSEAMEPEQMAREIEQAMLDIAQLEAELEEKKLLDQEKGETAEDMFVEHYTIPPHCIPINGDVRTFDWKGLGRAVQFDAIMMDPPWQLASANPTRGVALGYSQLKNQDIAELPIPLVQSEGFIFIWVINARYLFTVDLLKKWGYRVVDDITWIKSTINRRLAKGHGFYLQHAKETCLVGVKGNPACIPGAFGDVIIAERRGQSQKPEEIYNMIEALLPGGKYMEIFARRNNLRNYWVSLGNEL